MIVHERDISARAAGDALCLKHIHLPERSNTLGWMGRTVYATSPYERRLIRLWADGLGLERVYVRRTRALPCNDPEFGSFRDSFLLVMIAEAADYREFVDLLAAVPARTQRLPYTGKLTQDAARSLQGANFRILRGSLTQALSVEDGVL